MNRTGKCGCAASTVTEPIFNIINAHHGDHAMREELLDVGEFPLREKAQTIHTTLVEHFGAPLFTGCGDPVDELIATILSANTTTRTVGAPSTSCSRRLAAIGTRCARRRWTLSRRRSARRGCTTRRRRRSWRRWSGSRRTRQATICAAWRRCPSERRAPISPRCRASASRLPALCCSFASTRGLSGRHPHPAHFTAHWHQRTPRQPGQDHAHLGVAAAAQQFSTRCTST
jgi:hypothetical protein